MDKKGIDNAFGSFLRWWGTGLKSILVTAPRPVISRQRHGIVGYYGHAEIPAAGYRGISLPKMKCKGGVFRSTFVQQNIDIWKQGFVIFDSIRCIDAFRYLPQSYS